MKFIDELPLDDVTHCHQSSASGWGRLDVHARRVRTLYMETHRMIVISPNIYLRIRTMRDSPLLPGLKKIYIPYSPSRNVDLSSALFLASGSTLNMVQLDRNAISDRQFFVPFLSLLYIRSPGLSHLSLRGVESSASVEPIYRFTELQSLEIRLCNSHLDPQLLHELGQLPHLLDLIIYTGDIVTSGSIQPDAALLANPISTISNSKFGQLRRLQFVGTTTSINCMLNELEGSTNLTALRIDEVRNGRVQVGTDPDSSWRSSFEFKVISTFSAVEDIEIAHHDASDFTGNHRHRIEHVISASSLAPLYRLDKMKSFVFIDMVISGSDDDFRVLAASFPKLKKLVFPGQPLAFPIGGVFGGVGRTLACLYYLSQECPDLREVKIVLSFDISDNLNAIKNLPRPIVQNHHHPLKKLYIDSDFGQLELVQLDRVARFLDLIFPNLSILETNNKKRTEAANWTEINELRLVLQDARSNP